MKTLAFIATLTFALGASAPVGAIEVVSNAPAYPGYSARVPDLAAVPLKGTLPSSQLSELPEPEVFAMMLLGLVLIGYRASRDSSEKFK